MAFSLFERWSPEHALENALDDMKELGLDGLKKHLTSNALKTVESFESISENQGVALLTTALMGGSAVNILLEKLSECEWDVKEVMKGSDVSKAIVGFDYQDKMVGTVELKMIKEEKIWKIDGLAMPKFDKLDLPQADQSQPAES